VRPRKARGFTMAIRVHTAKDEEGTYRTTGIIRDAVVLQKAARRKNIGRA